MTKRPKTVTRCQPCLPQPPIFNLVSTPPRSSTPVALGRSTGTPTTSGATDQRTTCSDNINGCKYIDIAGCFSLQISSQFVRFKWNYIWNHTNSGSLFSSVVLYASSTAPCVKQQLNQSVFDLSLPSTLHYSFNRGDARKAKYGNATNLIGLICLYDLSTIRTMELLLKLLVLIGLLCLNYVETYFIYESPPKQQQLKPVKFPRISYYPYSTASFQIDILIYGYQLLFVYLQSNREGCRQTLCARRLYYDLFCHSLKMSVLWMAI